MSHAPLQLYHHTTAENAVQILFQGLRCACDKTGYGGIFLSEQASPADHGVVFRINTAEIPAGAISDDPTGRDCDDPADQWYVCHSDLPRTALHLQSAPENSRTQIDAVMQGVKAFDFNAQALTEASTRHRALWSEEARQQYDEWYDLKTKLPEGFNMQEAFPDKFFNIEQLERSAAEIHSEVQALRSERHAIILRTRTALGRLAGVLTPVEPAHNFAVRWRACATNWGQLCQQYFDGSSAFLLPSTDDSPSFRGFLKQLGIKNDVFCSLENSAHYGRIRTADVSCEELTAIGVEVISWWEADEPGTDTREFVVKVPATSMPLLLQTLPAAAIAVTFHDARYEGLSCDRYDRDACLGVLARIDFEKHRSTRSDRVGSLELAVRERLQTLQRAEASAEYTPGAP